MSGRHSAGSSTGKRRQAAFHAPDASVHRKIKKAKTDSNRTSSIIALKNLDKIKRLRPEAFEPIIKVCISALDVYICRSFALSIRLNPVHDVGVAYIISMP